MYSIQMNTAQRESIQALVAKHGIKLINTCSIAEVEKALGFNGEIESITNQLGYPQVMAAIYTMFGKRASLTQEDYLEFDGKKSLKLWTFTEHTGYDLNKMPEDPADYLGCENLTSEQQAAICDMLIFFNKTIWMGPSRAP
jgi:hypothetical protein